MVDIIAYEMQYTGEKVQSNIILTPFTDEFYQDYQRVYNECFYDMRKALNEKLIGSVACYRNEIDDLIVNKEYQGQGYGKLLLFWGINHIQKINDLPIKLHVAKWNDKAVRLYEKNNFKCIKAERVR